METWKFISKKLTAGQAVMLLYVLQSEGSSPGRQGFKMAVAADGEIYGTIGGGIMEHKLVEKAKFMLAQDGRKVLLQQQYHDKEKVKDQSGMICSGSQLNVFIPLSTADEANIDKILSSGKRSIKLSPAGLHTGDETANGLRYTTDADWVYTEPIDRQPVIHIIGGGHVALALSELMNYLGFYIKLYDDRPELNTIAANSFADEKHIINYETIASAFDRAEHDYVVIMTVGYRTDKLVLQQLIVKQFFYLGLLGSRHKIDTLFKELQEEGVGQQLLDNVFSPIGLDIGSKTTREIAVSIAAEIIREKNKV